MAGVCNAFQEAKSLSVAAEEIKSKQENGGSGILLLQWTDLDAEARALNHRRLLGEDIATSEHDKLISDRKKKRRDEENLWAWDDWLTEVKDKLKQKQQDGTDDPVLHCILEAPIPPWEVELCRDLEQDFELSTAADCIRCLSEDSSESELDAYDPSAGEKSSCQANEANRDPYIFLPVWSLCIDACLYYVHSFSFQL
jgi:hypothetical protein